MAAGDRSLLPPNATSAERSIEGATARLADVPVNFRQLWDPDTCPAGLLPWLAWGLSIDTWNPAWPENVKRAQIRASMGVHRRKGTVQAVEDTVAAFGAGLVIREWWQLTPKGTPHTFEITLTVADLEGAPPPADYIDDIIAQIGRVKPARSHFEFTQGLQSTGGVGVVAAARVGVFARLQLDA